MARLRTVGGYGRLLRQPRCSRCRRHGGFRRPCACNTLRLDNSTVHRTRSIVSALEFLHARWAPVLISKVTPGCPSHSLMSCSIQENVGKCVERFPSPGLWVVDERFAISTGPRDLESETVGGILRSRVERKDVIRMSRPFGKYVDRDFNKAVASIETRRTSGNATSAFHPCFDLWIRTLADSHERGDSVRFYDLFPLKHGRHDVESKADFPGGAWETLEEETKKGLYETILALKPVCGFIVREKG